MNIEGVGSPFHPVCYQKSYLMFFLEYLRKIFFCFAVGDEDEEDIRRRFVCADDRRGRQELLQRVRSGKYHYILPPDHILFHSKLLSVHPSISFVTLFLVPLVPPVPPTCNVLKSGQAGRAQTRRRFLESPILRSIGI